MEAIFHEKQEGSLCAQHCLNSLLQGAYYTPVDLSTLAQQMDELERTRMAENGEESEEYQRFLQQPSQNMDDSGYFSVQVISSALEVWGLELVPYSSTDERIKHASSSPCDMRAFICNYRDHWFTIRKIGKQWFNLNSLLSKPELISDTYLALFLAQLKNDGYSIFVVVGELPDCNADQILRLNPIVPRPKVPGDHRIQENRVGENRMQDNQLQDGRMQDSRMQDNRMQDTRMQDTRMQDNRMQDSRMQDSRMQDSRIQDSRMQDSYMQDTQMDVNRIKENRIQNSQSENSLESNRQISDPDLAAAIRLSLADEDEGSNSTDLEDCELQKAIHMSLQASEEDDEDSLLQKAIHMSLDY